MDHKNFLFSSRQPSINYRHPFLYILPSSHKMKMIEFNTLLSREWREEGKIKIKIKKKIKIQLDKEIYSMI